MTIIKTDNVILNFDNVCQLFIENFDEQSRIYAHTKDGENVLIYANTLTETSKVLDGIMYCLENNIKIIKI